MQTEKAKALNDFLIGAANLLLSTVYEGLVVPESNVNNISDLTEANFEKYYVDFEEELKLNILEYKEYEIVYKYISHYLSQIHNWGVFSNDFINNVFNLNLHVNELIKAKQLIEKYKRKISELLSGESYRGELHSFIYEVLNPSQDEELEPEFVPDPNFNFEHMMAEIKTQKLTTNQTLDFISNRQKDFLQWQIVNDTENEYDYMGKVTGKKHPLTKRHYKNFMQLCGVEIDRLNSKLVIEKNELTLAAISKNKVVIQTPATEKSPLKWNSTDTDFLELFAALYQNESIVRADGKPLTRKEMLDYFQSILGLEIKDPEGKLTKAGNRNDNTAFLDTLAQEFRNYVAGKEKKLRSRK